MSISCYISDTLITYLSHQISHMNTRLYIYLDIFILFKRQRETFVKRVYLSLRDLKFDSSCVCVCGATIIVLEHRSVLF